MTNRQIAMLILIGVVTYLIVFAVAVLREASVPR